LSETDRQKFNFSFLKSLIQDCEVTNQRELELWMQTNKAIHIIVSGLVQGVNYRVSYLFIKTKQNEIFSSLELIFSNLLLVLRHSPKKKHGNSDLLAQSRIYQTETLKFLLK
jgi:hypothetical protein